MKPMDREFIEQHDIAQRYLHGRLTPEEAEEFEVYLMDNPEMIEELELDSIFVSHTASLKNLEQKPAPWWAWFWQKPAGASFSTLCFSVGIMWLSFPWINNEIAEQGADTSTGIAGFEAKTHYFEIERSSNAQTPRVIEVSNKKLTHVFVLAPADLESSVFDVSILSSNDEEIFVFSALIRDGNGEISFATPGHVFEVDQYRIEVTSGDTLTPDKKQIVPFIVNQSRK